MNRVHYRRITPPRSGEAAIFRGQAAHNRPSRDTRSIARANANESEEPGALGQTLILQGLISGIILVCVMVICFIEIPPTTALRGHVRQSLAGATTVGEVAQHARQWGADRLGWEWSD